VARPWLVLREGERRRWGGDLRRRYLLDGLVEQTAATAQDDWRSAAIARTLRDLRGPRWQVWRGRPYVGATELLPPDRLAVLASLGEPIVVDVHDEPLVQNEALGIPTPEEEAMTIRERHRVNLEAFRFHVAPSAGFAELTGMDPARTLVASNGADPATSAALRAAAGGRLRGAAPAAASRRSSRPAPRPSDVSASSSASVVPTGEASQAYLDGSGPRRRPQWIVGRLRRAAGRLATTRVLGVPPANAYWTPPVDQALRLDGLPAPAGHAGREAAVVRTHDAGLVAA
jgi:hypothetical protein